MKQIDRLQIQLTEEKSRNREISAQLTEAADYKVWRCRKHTLAFQKKYILCRACAIYMRSCVIGRMILRV